MKDPAEQLVADIVSAYRKLPGCRAIALIGSRARGTAKPFSGVDLMLVYYTPISERERKSVIELLADKGTQSEILEYPITMDIFHRGGLQIKIFHASQDVICERVAIVEKRLRMVRTMLIASLFESKILWDPKNQLQAWKMRIQPVPEDYKLAIVPRIYGEVVNVLEDINSELDSQNFFYLHHEIIECIEKLYEMMFLLNNQYLNLSHRIDTIVSGFVLLPRGFLKTIRELLVIPNTGQGLRLKWRTLAGLTRQTGEFLITKGYSDVERSLERLKTVAPFLYKEGTDTPLRQSGTN